MEFDLENSRILLPVNSFPLSLCKVFGNPNMKNTFCSACTTCLHVLDMGLVKREVRGVGTTKDRRGMSEQEERGGW